MMNSNSDSNNGQLLRDIEEISKSLYLQKPSSNALITASNVRSKSAGKTRISESNAMHKDKKSSSLWNWKKPFKALAHVRRHRLDVCFFLHVHSIEGLPVFLNDSSLCVHWKGNGDVLSTHAVKVVDGVAEFEETLMVMCCVHGSKSGPRNSAKYDAKLFVIYASVVGPFGYGIGEHLIDLTRLLPLSLEDLVGKNSSGKWTTSFKLSGKAKGATLNISFGFLVTGDDLVESSSKMTASSFGSVPSNVNQVPYLSPLSVDVKFGTELLPNLGLELSKSVSFLYQKLNEGKLHRVSSLDNLSEHLEPAEPNSDFGKFIDEYENIEFSVIDQGVEMCHNDQFKLEQSAIQTIDGSAIETIDVDEILKDCDTDIDEEAEHLLNVYCSDICSEEVDVDKCVQEKSNICSKPLNLTELESDFHDLLIRESSVSESLSGLDEFIENENCSEVKSHYKASNPKKKSQSLDEIADSVASDFLKMLEIEHDPFSLNSDNVLDSPRERLLREFENEALASGDFILGFDAAREEEKIRSTTPDPCHGDNYDDFAFSSVIPHSKKQKESLSLANRRSIKMLEYLETEALMREWGLDEKAFQRSPRVQTDGFGSPIVLSSEQDELPPLGEGFGHFIPTKDGGVLLSMNRSHFMNCKNVGNLAMQVSRAAIFPAGLGTDVMEILQNLSSLGIENLSVQVNKLMPLEDITGKTLQQISLRAVVVDRLEQELLGEQDSFDQRNEVEGFQFCWTNENPSSGLIGGNIGQGCVSMENLVPSVLNRIEVLALEGLRIQCGLSDEDAPSSVDPFSSNNMPLIMGNDSNFSRFLGLEGAASSQPPDFEDYVNCFNRLMDLSITLDKWLRLDGGIIDDGDHICDQKLSIVSDDNFTLAVMVLLRDPYRNYEPVGTSMIALIQVERASVSVEPERAHEKNPEPEAAEKREGTPFYKITEVHLAGLSTEPDKQHLWGSKAQQQSGLRWLLASGTGNTNKKTFSQSKAIVRFYPSVMRKMETRNVLWSLTSNIHETGSSWNESADFGPHSRNPNVIFPN